MVMMDMRHYKKSKKKSSKKRSREAVNYRTGGYAGREVRFLDTSVEGRDIAVAISGATANPTTLLCLNAVGPGTGVSQRGGIRCTVKSIRINGVISFVPAFPSSGIVKLYLVKDKQTNGAQMTGTQYFDTAIASDFMSVMQHENLENAHRFSLLAKKTVKFVTQNHYWNGTTAVAPTVNVPFSLSKSFGASGMKVRFLGSGTTIADIADNSLHLLALCTDNSGSSAKISYISRMKFYAD